MTDIFKNIGPWENYFSFCFKIMTMTLKPNALTMYKVTYELTFSGSLPSHSPLQPHQHCAGQLCSGRVRHRGQKHLLRWHQLGQSGGTLPPGLQTHIQGIYIFKIYNIMKVHIISEYNIANTVLNT